MSHRPASRSRQLVVVVTLIIVVAVIAPIFLCSYVSMLGVKSMTSGCEPTALKELETAGSFTLPPSAKNLKSGCFGMQGWDGYAEFEMLPADLDAFVASTKLNAPLALNEAPKAFALATPASQAKSYLHGRFDSYVSKTDTTYYQELLVDTSDTSTYLVYLAFGGG